MISSFGPHCRRRRISPTRSNIARFHPRNHQNPYSSLFSIVSSIADLFIFGLLSFNALIPPTIVRNFIEACCNLSDEGPMMKKNRGCFQFISGMLKVAMTKGHWARSKGYLLHPQNVSPGKQLLPPILQRTFHQTHIYRTFCSWTLSMTKNPKVHLGFIWRGLWLHWTLKFLSLKEASTNFRNVKKIIIF